MRPILISLSIFVFFATVMSDDISLFSTTEPYPYDLGSSDDQSLWTDNPSLGTDDPLLGDFMFDETSSQMLSFDDCSSGDLGSAGDLGFTSKVRRGKVCSPETSSGTQGSVQTPTNPDLPPDDQNKNTPSPFDTFPYMPPPTFDNLGCANLWGKVFPYTVCGSSNRDDRTLSTELYVQLPSYTLKNAVLSK